MTAVFNQHQQAGGNMSIAFDKRERPTEAASQRRSWWVLTSKVSEEGIIPENMLHRRGGSTKADCRSITLRAGKAANLGGKGTSAGGKARVPTRGMTKPRFKPEQAPPPEDGARRDHARPGCYASPMSSRHVPIRPRSEVLVKQVFRP